MNLVIAERPIYPFYYLGTWSENRTTDPGQLHEVCTDGVLGSEMAKYVLK